MKCCQGKQAMHKIRIRVGFYWYLDPPGFLHHGVAAAKGEICGRGIVMHELKISGLKARDESGGWKRAGG